MAEIIKIPFYNKYPQIQLTACLFLWHSVTDSRGFKQMSLQLKNYKQKLQHHTMTELSLPLKFCFLSLQSLGHHYLFPSWCLNTGICSPAGAGHWNLAQNQLRGFQTVTNLFSKWIPIQLGLGSGSGRLTEDSLNFT